jgi:hypothetical protein
MQLYNSNGMIRLYVYVKRIELLLTKRNIDYIFSGHKGKIHLSDNVVIIFQDLSFCFYKSVCFSNIEGELFRLGCQESASSYIKFNLYEVSPPALITHVLKQPLRNEELFVQ